MSERRTDVPTLLRATIQAFRLLAALVVAEAVVTGLWVVPELLGSPALPAPLPATWAIIVTALLAVATLVTWQVRRSAMAGAELARWRLSAFAETAGEVPFECTADGTITYAGPRGLELLGYSPHEVIGQNMAIVVAPHELERARLLMADSLANRRGWTDERFTYLTRDGRAKELYSSVLVHLDAERRPVGFTGTLREVEPDAGDLVERRRTRERVEAVIEHELLRIVYQPIICLATGQVIGAEALSRFLAEPAMAPDQWFADAAGLGRGVDLELMAVAAALRSTGHLPRHAYLSVNVSPGTLASGRLVDVLARSRFPMSRLVVEITEHVSVEDYAALVPFVEELRAVGARIAVDDAGAGYASFRHILRLRPDHIKLDRTLVDGIDRDPAKRALAGAFVQFGQEVGATVVAEGIETADELTAAAALGIQSGQGFHIGRPEEAGPTWGRVRPDVVRAGVAV